MKSYDRFKNHIIFRFGKILPNISTWFGDVCCYFLCLLLLNFFLCTNFTIEKIRLDFSSSWSKKSRNGIPEFVWLQKHENVKFIEQIVHSLEIKTFWPFLFMLTNKTELSVLHHRSTVLKNYFSEKITVPSVGRFYKTLEFIKLLKRMNSTITEQIK